MERRAFLGAGLTGFALTLLPRALQGERGLRSTSGAPLIVRVPAQVKKDGSLVAEVLATGSGYMASDLLGSTSVITLAPGRPGQLSPLNLGPVRKPGVFSVQITVGADEYEAQLLVVPSTVANTFDISPIDIAVRNVPAASQTELKSGFQVLAAEYSPARLAAAAKAAGFDAVTTNLPNTIATGTVLVVGFAVILGPAAAAAGTAAGVAAIATRIVTSAGTEYVLDFGLTMYEKYVDQLKKDGKLTAAQATVLAKYGAASGAVLSLTQLKLDKGLAAKTAQALRGSGYVEKAVPQSTNPEAAQVIYGATGALTSKSVGVIRLLKL